MKTAVIGWAREEIPELGVPGFDKYMGVMRAVEACAVELQEI